jgi:hypothetical protein
LDIVLETDGLLRLLATSYRSLLQAKVQEVKASLASRKYRDARLNTVRLDVANAALTISQNRSTRCWHLFVELVGAADDAGAGAFVVFEAIMLSFWYALDDIAPSYQPPNVTNDDIASPSSTVTVPTSLESSGASPSRSQPVIAAAVARADADSDDEVFDVDWLNTRRLCFLPDPTVALAYHQACAALHRTLKQLSKLVPMSFLYSVRAYCFSAVKCDKATAIGDATVANSLHLVTFTANKEAFDGFVFCRWDFFVAVLLPLARWIHWKCQGSLQHLDDVMARLNRTQSVEVLDRRLDVWFGSRFRTLSHFRGEKERWTPSQLRTAVAQRLVVGRKLALTFASFICAERLRNASDKARFKFADDSHPSKPLAPSQKAKFVPKKLRSEE